jgi:hypothetical protein
MSSLLERLMATTVHTPFHTSDRITPDTHALGGLRFDWLMAALGLWLISGLYLDGWAHNHNPNLETFFTPWHGVLYSGFLMQVAVLGGLFIRNLRRGYAMSMALPQGYGLSLIGAGIFMIGGLGDMIWHMVFGIEVGVEALLSPTHLILAVGGSLLITGPLRAALQRNDSDTSPVAQLPMLLSASLLHAILTFFSTYANPLASTWVSRMDGPSASYAYVTQAIGITSFLFQSALTSAIVLILLRNNKLRPGYLTVMLTLSAGLSVAMNDIFLAGNPWLLFLCAPAAGIVGDVLLWLLKPSIANIRNLRIFITVLPTVQYLLYFVILLTTVGLWWSIHMWTGAIVLTGVMGWLMSYLVIPSGYEKVTVVPG